jgi:hypothetical protein
MKLDIAQTQAHNRQMRGVAADIQLPPTFASSIRQRIERGGEKIWRLEDFRDLPFSATAQTLSRLTRQGLLERLSKGTYYRSRETMFGKSRPNPSALRQLASRHAPIFPAGIAAANLLGFSTQTAGQPEVATSAPSLPRKLMGDGIIIHTRRPEAWAHLSEADAALLDFLRNTGKHSELTPEKTISRTLALMSEGGRFNRLLNAAASEPPRVRAILGALGQQLGIAPSLLHPLRESLNPLSRFDFGLFAALLYARHWQAKGPSPT